MSTQFEYKIIQIRLQKILFKKCPCKGFVVPVVTSGLYQDTLLYCDRCNKIIKEPVMNYTFDMTVLNLFENVVETVSVYDKIAEDFIGCSPEQLTRYLQEDKSLLAKLEEIGKGMYITVETFPQKEAFSSRKAKKITYNYEGDDSEMKLIDILNKRT
ncbi:hypothetical protein BDF21DRAFT_418602 [Thamnidium elegans]|nr:hypothetical protein BDF21DRAFT_418602 [Thamnidium elegans]